MARAPDVLTPIRVRDGSARDATRLLRLLGIGEASLRLVLDDYEARLADAAGALTPTARLDALKAAWTRQAPHAAPLPIWSSPPRCPICDGASVRPLLARRVEGAPPLVYGRCAVCGHLLLVEGAAPSRARAPDAAPDPVAALRLAAAQLPPDGALALSVPSADAVELSVFGASYPPLRAARLHLFSRDSIKRALAAAGLVSVVLTSTRGQRLLAGFLSPDELAALDAGGRGPDLRVVARRRSG